MGFHVVSGLLLILYLLDG